MQGTFISGVVALPAADMGANTPQWWFLVRNGEVLVRPEGGGERGERHEAVSVPRAESVAALGLLTLHPPQYLGALDGVACWSAEVGRDAAPPDGMRFAPLRGLYGRLPDDLFTIAGKAVQIVAWDRTHQYCGRCGTHTEYLVGERATRCPACGLVSYPRMSPAVIVRINRGPELLLARGHAFMNGMYSILAGFVEPGESLEEAVAREVMEEVGVTLTDIRYYASQPWPFPNSLMLGFTAAYAEGEITIDPGELADAQWFRWDALPRIPPPPSIARRLIDAFVATQGSAVPVSP